ncbi:hypothetical protein GCM10011571_24770 [Marinithermofilum abyssi]|uniref:Uncharacterized protein n=1 Tax=Marinithermofilum abyssi TaxID=1571185 RepID=A0A8J2YED0_9BACL|nr:hypothetical protein GCM10011571_24770 [Marinithermofilum abyssi]
MGACNETDPEYSRVGLGRGFAVGATVGFTRLSPSLWMAVGKVRGLEEEGLLPAGRITFTNDTEARFEVARYCMSIELI